MNDLNHSTAIKCSGADEAATKSEPSRFEQVGPLLLVGLREPLTEKAEQELPILWDRFLASVDGIGNRIDKSCYGLCVQTNNINPDYYYMACCAVSDFADLEEGLSPIIIPSQNYAVFTHKEHLSQIRQTISNAFDKWLPSSGWKLAEQSIHRIHFFEKYTEKFDLSFPVGGIEIWVPVTSSPAVALAP